MKQGRPREIISMMDCGCGIRVRHKDKEKVDSKDNEHNDHLCIASDGRARETSSSRHFHRQRLIKPKTLNNTKIRKRSVKSPQNRHCYHQPP